MNICWEYEACLMHNAVKQNYSFFLSVGYSEPSRVPGSNIRHALRDTEDYLN